MNKEIKVLELFAGVGGFRIGLEESSEEVFKTKWANQWEPSRKTQDAFQVYDYHFKDSVNIGESIEDITEEEFKEMDADMIVGGFPCQDYSVARTSKNNTGLEGKKGVLFWDIVRATDVIRPKYLLLENVDRLLKSPTKQRGRDFAVMLAAFNQLGYSVEWRVINAAEYGRAQRRRRVFIFAFRNDLGYAKGIDQRLRVKESAEVFKGHIFKEGMYAKQFPIKEEIVKKRHTFGELDSDVVNVSDDYSLGNMWNAGLMHKGEFHTFETMPVKEEPITLGEIIQEESEVKDSVYLDEDQIERFDYLRGSKKIERETAEGHKYTYSEGGMSPYDGLDLPGRTMLTSEGLVNRSTHYLKVNERYRIITPIEAERMQDFPDDWTRYKLEDGEVKEVSDRRRLFFMGNALVTGIVKRLADGIVEIDKL